jgi:hypothetical protein
METKKNNENTYYRYITIISAFIAKGRNKNKSGEKIGECE